MVSNTERRKGASGERELVELLNEFGADAERTYYQPGSKKADVDSLFGRFEVKRRARFVAYDWLHDDVRGVYVRADNKPGLVILRAKDAMRLLRLEREYRKDQVPIMDELTAKDVAQTLLKMPEDRRAATLEALKKALERKGEGR
jgi:Holliday junction resolvase